MPAASATSAPSSAARRAYVVLLAGVGARPRRGRRRWCRRSGRSAGPGSSRCAVRSGTGQSRWAICVRRRWSRDSTSKACSASIVTPGQRHVHVDPAPVVVPPVGGVGEDRAGGEVGALLPADRLERRRPAACRWLGRTRTSTSLDWRPSARSPGRTAGPLRWSRSMPRGRRRASGRPRGRGGRAPRWAPARPSGSLASCAHRASRRRRRCRSFDRTGAASRPRLASMTFGDFVRLSRAYVWVLIGCTILGALLMIAKTTREPVLYSATSSGLVRVGNATHGGRGAGQRAARRGQGQPLRLPRLHDAGRRAGRRRARPRRAARRDRRPVLGVGRRRASTRSPSPPSAPRPRRRATSPTRSSTPWSSSPRRSRPARRTPRSRRSRASCRSRRRSCPGAPFTPDYAARGDEGRGRRPGPGLRLPDRPPPDRPPGPLGQARRGGHRRRRARHHPQGGRARPHPPRRARRPRSARRRRSASCAPTCASSTSTTSPARSW